MRTSFYTSFIALGFACMSCSKPYQMPAPQSLKPVPVVQTTNFTLADADVAYTAFNNYFYNPTTKLYYNATDRSGIGAIWTQAIYWDLAMDVYERKKSDPQLKMITDIYAGGASQYDNYNWNNQTTWFIYDDMMWWVTALARANQLTGNAAYLQNSIAGFNHVWAGSYDPVDGGMFWDFQHRQKCLY